jgi:hypothetical protein
MVDSFALKFFVTAVLIPTDDNNPDTSEVVCFIQAIWAQFWGLGSVSWNGTIALNIMLELRYLLLLQAKPSQAKPSQAKPSQANCSIDRY